MNRRPIRTALLVLSVLAACVPAVQPTPTPTPELPAGVVVAKEMLSQAEEIPLDEIEVISFERRDWPDGCLGLGRADEGCIQVITPGYRVILEADGDRYVYRTDEAGNAVRREE